MDLLTTAGLIPVLSNNTDYTLLAPPEDKLQEIKSESPERLRLILANHILKGKYLEKDFKDGATVETLAGSNIRICRKKDYTLMNGVKLQNSGVSLGNGSVVSLGNRIAL
ncbi:fasciclin domain-containing protein [Pontibacter sp. SGAir0037]|uniref:fasciclin domain-containing protein n=1 Tax=Pontibacter sp. SGAir0037 TaxID=2571030 RepID=UPI00143DC701|nr:fasciclin domain-containing protein [Pontibacter sp. SGAir0037]